MKWYDNLYIGESIGKKAGRIKWKINHNAGTLFVHVITLPSNKHNLLDIIPARELLQNGYPKRNLKIIGIAGDRQEAVELVAEIIKEVYDNTGETDVAGYLEKRGGW